MFLEGLETRLVPANYTVNGLGDAGIGNGNAGDLRYCINQANGQMGASTITFQNGLQGTIQLGGSLPTLGKDITINETAVGAVTIQGGGAKNPFTIFNVGAATCEIDGLTIEDGTANGVGGGGGIVNGGTLTLNKDEFYGDDAVVAGGKGGYGGAIVNGPTSTLNVSNCTFADNSAGTFGGAIANFGTLTCSGTQIFLNYAKDGGGIAGLFGAKTTLQDDTQVYANTATGRGGGIFETAGSMWLTGFSGGYVTGNDATNGGGIYVASGSLTIKLGFAVENNQAINGGNGGGLYIAAGTVGVSSASIYGNSATSGSGGGIYNAGGTLTLSGGTEIGKVGSGNSAGVNGGGVHCAIGSTTTFNGVTVSGNQLTGKPVKGKGVGIYQQNNGVQKATVNLIKWTDNDDLGGNPVQGP